VSDVTLVTGGAGFIGSHLVRLLVDRGARVRVLDRRSRPLPDARGSDVEYITADIRDRDAVRRAVRGSRVVYHLAANPQLWTHRRGHFRQINYLGAVNVIEEALASGAERVLHTSTESILTRRRQPGPIAEDQRVPLADVVGPYCRSKWYAERFALRLGRAGAPVVVVNPTLPIGPGDSGRSPPTQMLLDCCRGKRSAYLDADLNLIDVRDVALGLVRAFERGTPGRRYLLGGENWSICRVFTWIAQHTGQPEPRWRVPYPVALAAAYVSEFIADVGTRRIPSATVTGVKLTRRTMQFDASRSLAELDLRPRAVEDSLRDAIAWFRELGWISASFRGWVREEGEKTLALAGDKSHPLDSAHEAIRRATTAP
jgi:hopanoid-associated sugar epimerase